MKVDLKYDNVYTTVLFGSFFFSNCLIAGISHPRGLQNAVITY